LTVHVHPILQFVVLAFAIVILLAMLMR